VLQVEFSCAVRPLHIYFVALYLALGNSAVGSNNKNSKKRRNLGKILDPLEFVD
jgi:hypothetical protein